MRPATMPDRADLAARRRARDAAVRRTRGVVAAVAAGAVGFSGVLSAVAAQAFKGHTRHPAATPTTTVAPGRRARSGAGSNTADRRPTRSAGAAGAAPGGGARHLGVRTGAAGRGRLVSISRWTALGTSVSLVVAGGDDGAAQRAVEVVLAAIDRACSRFRADSELSAVNDAMGCAVQVSSLLLDAVTVALRAAALTDGTVDPTVGTALVLAGYDRDFGAVRDSRVQRVRATRVAGWHVVQIDRATATVRVPAGVRLDLGATAKAFAADLAAERALAAGEASGVLVNLGGDIATAGAAPPGGWAVRVADSHRARPGDAGQDLRIVSGALATSSTTVRRWRRRGGVAHHIIDPRTGGCAAEHWRTVSVAALTCVDANVASTAAIVLGPAAPAWLAELGLPARLVAADGTVATVAGWPDETAVAA